MTHIEAINIYTGMPLVDILNAFSVSELGSKVHSLPQTAIL